MNTQKKYWKIVMDETLSKNISRHKSNLEKIHTLGSDNFTEPD